MFPRGSFTDFAPDDETFLSQDAPLQELLPAQIPYHVLKNYFESTGCLPLTPENRIGSYFPQSM